MEKRLVRIILSTLVFLIAHSTPTAAQQTKETAMVSAVLDFRAHWVGDTTRVDGCSVYEALGRPANFPAGIDPSLVRLLDRTSDPCAADSTRVAARWPRYFVRIERIATQGSTGPRVIVRVVKHEYGYEEAYLLRFWSSGSGQWASVTEVRTSHLFQSLPVPPGRRSMPNVAP